VSEGGPRGATTAPLPQDPVEIAGVK